MSDDAPSMTSYRPYLLRALTEWINDNGMTPHVMVDAGVPGVQVPSSAIKEERVVLNIAERAVAKLELGNDAIRFTARFAGVSQAVMVPLEAVIAIFSRETGQGMAMPDEPRPAASQSSEPEVVEQADDVPSPGDAPDAPDTPPEPPKRGGHLRIVK